LRELQRMDFAGWLVVEAEQDPAIAHPLTYAGWALRISRAWLPMQDSR